MTLPAKYLLLCKIFLFFINVFLFFIIQVAEDCDNCAKKDYGK